MYCSHITVFAVVPLVFFLLLAQIKLVCETFPEAQFHCYGGQVAVLPLKDVCASILASGDLRILYY